MEKEFTKVLEETKKLIATELKEKRFWYLDWPGNPRFHQSDENAGRKK